MYCQSSDFCIKDLLFISDRSTKIFSRCEMYDTGNNMSRKNDKAYQVGDEILHCKIPFAYVVNKKLADTTCDECLKRSTDVNFADTSFLRCSGNYIMELRPYYQLENRPNYFC